MRTALPNPGAAVAARRECRPRATPDCGNPTFSRSPLGPPGSAAPGDGARAGTSLRSVGTLRWLVAATLGGTFALLGTSAVLRPYADNQRNWLVIGALLVGVALAALVFARPLRSTAMAIADEWKRRE